MYSLRPEFIIFLMIGSVGAFKYLKEPDPNYKPWTVPHGWFWLPGVDHVHDGTKAYGAYANMEKHFGNPDLAYVIPEISVDEFDDWLMTDLDRYKYVGFVVDERWSYLSGRFACYLNEVAYMFVNNQASFCNAYHLDNGTIDELAGVNTAEKVKFAIVNIDRKFMERHQIPGFPYLRLYKPNGEQLDYFGNMHVDYPFPVAAMRNFVGETAFDEDIAHPCMTYPMMPKRRHFNTTLYDDHFKWPFGKYCEHVIHTPRELKMLMPTKIRDLKNFVQTYAREDYLRIQGVRKNEWLAGSKGYMERPFGYITEDFNKIKDIVLQMAWESRARPYYKTNKDNWHTPPLYGHRNQWKSLEDTYF